MLFCWSSRLRDQVLILQTPTLRDRAVARIARQAISGSSGGCRRPDHKGRDHAAPDADFSDTIPTRRLVARSTAHARGLVRMPHNRCNRWLDPSTGGSQHALAPFPLAVDPPVAAVHRPTICHRR
jgi:hypothetical protein